MTTADATHESLAESAASRAARDAFESLADELAAIDPASVPAYNLDAVYARSVASATVGRIAPHLPMMARLVDFDMKHATRLGLLADALLHANALVLAKGAPPENFGDDLKEATKLRDLLLSHGATLVMTEKFDAKVIEDIKAGTGHRDLIADATALVALYNSQPEVLVEGGVVTRETISRMSELAQSLSNALGLRLGKTGKKELTELQIERAKVASLLLEANDQVRRAIGYLRYSQGDVSEIAPFLNVTGGGRSKADATPEKPEEPTKPTKLETPAKFSPADPEDNPFEDPK